MSNKHNNPNEVTTPPTRAPIPARDNAGGDGVFSLACKIHVVVPPIWFAHGWASWRVRRGDLVLTGNVKREESPAPTPSLGEGASSQSPPPAPSLREGVQGERRPYRLCSVIVGGLAPGQKSPPVFASRGGRRWATAQQARLVAAQENERSPLLILTGVACDDRVVWTPMGWPEGAGYRTVELVGGGA